LSSDHNPGAARGSVVSRLNVARFAGQKAPADVRAIAAQLGFHPVDLAPFSREGRWARFASIARAAMQSVAAVPVLARTPVLLVQRPLGRVNEVMLGRLARRAPSILLVHDLESLRQTGYDLREKESLGSYDVVIVHTPAMAAHLRQLLPETRTVVLGCFDYLVADAPEPPPLADGPRALYVIGRLSPDKAAYLYALEDLPLPVRAYGQGCAVDQLPASVRWDGVLDMDQPRLPARDGFGVVWDGTSPSALEGPTGSYLRYISPHKFSMYMVLGLPVVVPAESAMAQFVREEGVGLLADSFADGAAQAAACTREQWEQMADAVLRVRDSLLTGSRTKNALQSALELLGRAEGVEASPDAATGGAGPRRSASPLRARRR
jgi:hypothetical protein